MTQDELVQAIGGHITDASKLNNPPVDYIAALWQLKDAVTAAESDKEVEEYVNLWKQMMEA